MKRIVMLLLMGVLCLSMGNVCYATELDIPEEEGVPDDYQTVSAFYQSLKKDGSEKAVWTASATSKNDITAMCGTIKLVNGSGKTVKTENVSFEKSGSVFASKKKVSNIKKGTYYVKCSIKTYSSGKYKETISGKTNTISFK